MNALTDVIADAEEGPMIGMFPTAARWIERGRGEHVVFLHGLMGEMAHWESTLQALAPRCRALAPELPIFDAEQAEASIEGLADYVDRFMLALHIDRAVLGGNSLGGHLALELALTRPERVAGLILTGSSGLFERSFTRGVPHVPTTEFVRDRMQEVFYDSAYVTPAWVESVRRILVTRRCARRLVQVARSAKRNSVESRLGALRVPTLLVWGKDDRITPVEIAERFRALIADAELVTIANCGHAPMLEQPAMFNAIVEDWLIDSRARRARSAR